MTQQPDINIQAPRLDRAIAPSKGIPFTPYTYRGAEPWTPKNTKSPKTRRSNKYL